MWNTGSRCTNNRIHVGPFFNSVNLIDCSFSTTNENDVILGRSYVGPILPLVQQPPGVQTDWVSARLGILDKVILSWRVARRLGQAMIGKLGWAEPGWAGLGRAWPCCAVLCWVGLGWAGLGWAGLGWAGLGWAGLGWAGLGWAGLGWAGLGWAGLGRAGPGRAGPGRPGPARPGLGRAGPGWQTIIYIRNSITSVECPT